MGNRPRISSVEKYSKSLYGEWGEYAEKVETAARLYNALYGSIKKEGRILWPSFHQRVIDQSYRFKKIASSSDAIFRQVDDFFKKTRKQQGDYMNLRRVLSDYMNDITLQERWLSSSIDTIDSLPSGGLESDTRSCLLALQDNYTSFWNGSIVMGDDNILATLQQSLKKKEEYILEQESQRNMVYDQKYLNNILSRVDSMSQYNFIESRQWILQETLLMLFFGDTISHLSALYRQYSYYNTILQSDSIQTIPFRKWNEWLKKKDKVIDMLLYSLSQMQSALWIGCFEEAKMVNIGNFIGKMSFFCKKLHKEIWACAQEAMQRVRVEK